MSINEVLYFSDRLEEAKMPRGALVVNRFRLPPPGADRPPTQAEAAEAIARHGLHLEEDAPDRLVRAFGDAVRLAALDAQHLTALGDRAKGRFPVVRVPELPTDVHDLGNLGELAETLMKGGV
jgi:hypothetical protein